MIVVKVGGSLITNKSSVAAPRFRDEVALRLARELRGAGPLVLVHGAGSWGHPLALRYRVGRTRLAGRRLLEAVTRIQASVAELRAKFANACRRARLPVVELPASALAVQRRGGLAFDAALVRFYLERGFIPLTCGDIILDDRLGARVLSGDEIAAVLARELAPRRVVFASDVPGVLRERRVVARLTPEEALTFAADGARDATGGMGGKLRQAALIAAQGVPVHVVDGRREGRLRRACAGRGDGTLIERGPPARRRPGSATGRA